MTTDKIMQLVEQYARASMAGDSMARLSARHSIYTAIAQQGDPIAGTLECVAMKRITTDEVKRIAQFHVSYHARENYFDDLIDFARAIEAAHGIVEDSDT